MKKRYLHSTNRSRARLVGLFAALAVVIAGAITVVSRQTDRAASVRNSQPETVADSTAPIRATSQDKSVAQTTPIQEITAEEARILTEAVKPMVNKSTEGLVESIGADGGVAVDVKDRFQNVTIARRNADGSISYTCIDTPESASAFFQPERNPQQPGVGTRATPVRH